MMKIMEESLEEPICRLAYDFIHLASHSNACEKPNDNEDFDCTCGYAKTFQLAMRVLHDHAVEEKAS